MFEKSYADALVYKIPKRPETLEDPVAVLSCIMSAMFCPPLDGKRTVEGGQCYSREQIARAVYILEQFRDHHAANRRSD